MPISGDHPRFVKNHGDALTNVLRMYHGLSRFPKSWTSGTKDRDSVTEANEDVVRKNKNNNTNKLTDMEVRSGGRGMCTLSRKFFRYFV